MLGIHQLRVEYGEGATVAVDGVDLTVADAEIVCVLGPSGSGKSTLLRAVAGLERPAAGRVTWDGDDLAAVPPHRREFGLMFQDHALFPHRDVLGNVAFGLRMQRRGRAEVDLTARDALARVGLAGFGHRAVRELSGGEQQRVALARALAPGPRLLMLDEPLGSLDRELRERLAVELRGLFVDLAVTAIFVTHDQDEAFALADRVVVMRDGRIEQIGVPEQLWRTPGNEFVARFLGFANVVDAVVDGDTVRSAWGVVHRRELRGADSVPDGPARLAGRPDALRIDPSGLVRGRVLGATFRRDHFLVRVATDDGTFEVADATPPTTGDTVAITADTTALVVLPA